MTRIYTDKKVTVQPVSSENLFRKIRANPRHPCHPCSIKKLIRYIRSLFIAIMLVGCVQSSGLALNNEEVFSQFQFNFITPGARATAMGGAFIGLADDATAVESNPAGLTVLTAPEISAEFKYFGYTIEHVYDTGGYIEVLSSEASITTKEFDNSVESIPFLSFVYPYKRFVFSLYRQELMNYKGSYRTASTLGSGSPFISPTDASVDLIVTNYGIGIATEIFEGLSLAVSPRLSRMSIQSRNSSFRLPLPLGRFTTDFSADEIFSETIINDEDIGLSLNAGLMWNPHPKVSVGLVYKSGTKFTVTEKPGRDPEQIQEMNFLNPDAENYDPDLAEFTLKVPTSYGAGVAFRVTDFLTLTCDVLHIQYEDLLKDFDVLDPYYQIFEEITGRKWEERYIVNNVTELHFGAEYILSVGKRLLALRAGVYNEPDHTIRYGGFSRPNERISGDEFLFSGGDDQIHFTGGVGLVLRDRFQIDTAVDIADKRKQFSFSMVYRFGREKTRIPKKKSDLTRAAVPTLTEKALPSVTFMVVKSGKTLEIQSITTDTPGISDVNVTINQTGKTKFVVTAALEKDKKTFTTDIEIRIGFQSFTVKAMDEGGQVKVLSEKPKSLEVMVTFGEERR